MTGLGREPTAEEIAEVTGIEPDEVESIKRSAQAPISLEKPVGDEEQSEFGQFIADEQAESPYERAVEILTKEALRDALENLSYRERRVLELRYGLGGEHPRTLDEVGRTFNVTRERIRQIENQSLKKLQNLAEAQQLRDDVDRGRIGAELDLLNSHEPGAAVATADSCLARRLSRQPVASALSDQPADDARMAVHLHVDERLGAREACDPGEPLEGGVREPPETNSSRAYTSPGSETRITGPSRSPGSPP